MAAEVFYGILNRRRVDDVALLPCAAQQEVDGDDLYDLHIAVVLRVDDAVLNRGNEESDAIAALTTAVRTAKTYLQQCGNELLVPDNYDLHIAVVLRVDDAVFYLPDGEVGGGGV